jgi:hypothetical protein
MITTVSTWRCKCGARIKVVGQTPKGQPSPTQPAACPQCGDTQMIYGTTILSISIEEDAKVQEA